MLPGFATISWPMAMFSMKSTKLVSSDVLFRDAARRANRSDELVMISKWPRASRDETGT